MGGGSWTDDKFRAYSTSKGRAVGASGALEGSYSNQEMFRAKRLDPALDPKNAVRECCDSEEHPYVVPVILALDVTGSMGDAAVEVAKKLNVVMTELYSKVSDVQFLIMGIGDMTFDRAPVQASQFESDIRIADQLEKIWFEFGGGDNPFESYTLPWYFALHHTKIDAIDKRGKKGIIITMGDECINPYLPKTGLRTSFSEVFGDNIQSDINTTTLYEEVSQKFECFHIHVNHGGRSSGRELMCVDTFKDILGQGKVFSATLDNIAEVLVNIISNNANTDIGITNTVISSSNVVTKNENGEIVW